MQLLENHVVLVTGGGSGLGLGVARHCHAEGAQVIVADVSADKIRQLQDDFPEALALQCDVTRLAELQACRDAIVERYGRLDAVIGAQGIFDGNLPLLRMAPERIDAVFDELFHVNVKGYLLTARVFHDLLKASQGALVLTSSTAAYAADGGGVFYTATKGAIRSLVGQLAFEFAPDVRVNCVAPAGIANSQLRGPRTLGLDAHKQSDIPKDAFLAMFRTLSLLQELPTPEDHGPLYAFLASRHNKIMTGQTVVADQGMLNRAVLHSGG